MTKRTRSSRIENPNSACGYHQVMKAGRLMALVWTLAAPWVVSHAAQVGKRPWVAGSWVEVDCSAIPPKLILRAGKSRVAFLLDSVEALEVTGTGNDDSLELPCGAHKPTPVWVEYDPPSANQRGVKGLARAIHFEPVPTGLKTR